jgi:hypothetical protein
MPALAADKRFEGVTVDVDRSFQERFSYPARGHRHTQLYQ